MKKNIPLILSSVVALSLLIGCGGSDSNIDDQNDIISTQSYTLVAQTGTENYLFYGETNHKSLGSLSNMRVISASTPQNILVQDDDTTATSYPVLSTKIASYNSSDKSYKNLYVSTLSYISNGYAYTVPMQKANTLPAAQRNSNAGKLSNIDYQDIHYLTTTQYLTAHDDVTNKTVLITPDMGPNDMALDIGDRKFLTVTYLTYGAEIDGYLFYNNSTSKVEKCSLDMQTCTGLNIPNVGSRDFEDDLFGSVYSVFLVDDTHLYKVNKSNASVKEVNFGNVVINRLYTQDDSVYIVTDEDDVNIYRVNMLTEQTIKITQVGDSRIERIRAFTDDWVIYGSDTLLMATKKQDASDTAIKLAETTKTKGYKYVKDFDMADRFLFVPYSINITTRKTSFKACIFENSDGSIDCKDNAFWGGVVIAKNGKMSVKSGYPYTPYAYVRVDETDSFGGGKLKAIDPRYPLDDGLNMGIVANYNFQTFMSNSRYAQQMIDDNGGIVLFAKNDTNFHVDAFYMNLLKKNSLIQLTNTDPGVDISLGRDHCHGRHCMICHSFSGGKIYVDKSGSSSAYGYKIRLDFEDGTVLDANVSKGKSENFSMPLQKFVGNFKASVLDENETVVNQSDSYYHEGLEYANCNYCHARDGATRYGAPGAISIVPIP